MQDFANWGREPEDILRFTRRFGPLARSAQGGKPFTVKVSEWLRRQDAFRAEWDDVALRNDEDEKEEQSPSESR